MAKNKKPERTVNVRVVRETIDPNAKAKVAELTARISKKLESDPEEAKKAALIIERWLGKNKNKQVKRSA